MQKVGHIAVVCSCCSVRKVGRHSLQVNAERGERSKDTSRPRQSGERSARECDEQCVCVFWTDAIIRVRGEEQLVAAVHRTLQLRVLCEE